MDEVKHESCGRCKCWRLPVDFLNTKGRKLKTCLSCRARNAREREHQKCEHSKSKYACRLCGGSLSCEHKDEKRYCRPCGGVDVCEHALNKRQCYKCNPQNFCGHRVLISRKCLEC